MTTPDGSHVADIYGQRGLPFKIATLYAQIQVLAAILFAALSGLAFFNSPRILWGPLGLPTFVASLGGFALAVGFLCRRRWARVCLIVECALIPMPAIYWLIRSASLGHGPDAVTAGCLLVGSAAGAVAFGSRAVRAWTDSRP